MICSKDPPITHHNEWNGVTPSALCSPHATAKSGLKARLEIIENPWCTTKRDAIRRSKRSDISARLVCGEVTYFASCLFCKQVDSSHFFLSLIQPENAGSLIVYNTDAWQNPNKRTLSEHC